jgi:hypothetical protein
MEGPATTNIIESNKKFTQSKEDVIYWEEFLGNYGKKERD